MNKVIAYRNTSGGTTVLYPTGTLPIDEVILKDVPDGADYLVLDRQQLPEVRDFREAWRLSVASLTVDLEAAKEVTKNRLRSERAALLAELDIQIIRAVESGADTSAIVAEKQRLRDITKLADDAKSLDELREISVSKTSESDSRR